MNTKRIHKILVVEDDKEIRESLQDTLEMLGYVAMSASNGQEALDLLKSTDKPCLILLDLMMPVMSGWEFRAVQKNHPDLHDIPIVIVTADARAKSKAAGLGITSYLKKPFDIESLKSIALLHCNPAS